MKKSIFLSLLLLAGIIATGQRVPSEDLIREGIRLYGEGNYDKAIETYRMVHENDSNYVWMLGELALTFIQTGHYDSTVYYARKAMALPSGQRQHLLRTKGTALDQMGETDKAIATYLEAIRLYPYAYMLRFNLGVTYMQQGDFPRAAECFQESLRCNPFHTTSHLLLGMIMARQGHFTRAIMAFQTFLAIEPHSQRSNEGLVWVENLSSNFLPPSLGDPIEPFTSNELFMEVDHLLKSRAVLNERYPAPIPFDANLVKQTSMILEMLPLDSESDDFWVQMYFPFYRAIRDGNHIEPFLYTILTSSGRESVSNYHEHRRNQRARSEFFATGSYLTQLHSYRQIERDGEVLTLKADYYEDGNILSLGNTGPDGKEYGRWFYFHPNGELMSEGYKVDGENDGKWIYYHINGLKSNVENFRNGMLHGELTSYHFEVTVPSLKANFVDNEIEGEVSWYNIFGIREQMFTFRNSTRHGEARFYFPTSHLKDRFTHVDGMVHGESVSFHINGQPLIISNYTEDEQDGEYREYFPDGTISLTGHYRQGLEHGDWKFYHVNGNVKAEKTFRDGKSVGMIREYHHNGKLHLERWFNDEGELHGVTTTWDRRGHKRMEEEFVDGTIVSVVSGWNAPGGPRTYGSADGTFSFIAYYPCGAKWISGAFEKGLNTGEWKRYFRNGNTQSSFTYVDDKLEGDFFTWYPNGAMESVMEYADGVPHGTFRNYYRDGTLESQGFFEQGIEDYLWYNYYPSGQLKTTSYFENGSITGWLTSLSVDGKRMIRVRTFEGGVVESILFGPDGQVTESHNFLQDTLFRISYAPGHVMAIGSVIGGEYHGDYTWYHPGGNVSTRSKRMLSKYTGEFRRYDPDGNLITLGDHFEDYKHGTWTNYFPNGNVESVEHYFLDEKDSTHIEYFENGSKRLVENYFNGELDGDVLFYEPGGQLMVKIIYAGDEIIGYQYMQNGQLTDTIAFTEHDQVIRAFYENGTPAFEQHFLNFVPHGPRLKYYANGSVMERREYKEGMLHGLNESFYPDGKPQERFTCENHMYEGEYITWWPNGNKKKVVTYFNDQEHGPTSYYNEDGKLLRVENYWSGGFTGFIE